MSQAPGPSADELELAAAAASINRAKSAPPAAVNAAPSLFSPNTGYAALFGDMRLSEHYELFAQTMRDPRLPPPLQYSVYRDVSAQREISSLGAASPHLAVQADTAPQPEYIQRIWNTASGPAASAFQQPALVPMAESSSPWRQPSVTGLENQLSGMTIGLQPSPTGPSPRIPSPPKSPGAGGGSAQRPPCRYYMQGHCTRGSSCPFSHVDFPASPGPAAPGMSAVASPSAMLSPGGGGRYGPAGAPVLSPVDPAYSTPLSLGGMYSGYPGGLSPMQQPQQQQQHHLPLSPQSPGAQSQRSGGGRKQDRGPGYPAGPRFPIDTKIATLEQAVGRMYQLSRDQWGCRFLQAKLDENAGAVTPVLAELLEHFAELMVDPFGNYLCQKVLEKASSAQRCAIIEGVMPSLVSIAHNMHGTRAVQKLVECVSSADEADLIRAALAGSVVPLIMDLNGNHVIQRCLHHLGPQYNQFIFDAVAADVVAVATHRHGCCVLQRCVDYATTPQKIQLLGVVALSTRALVRDAFGNYVIQYALDQHVPSASHGIITQLLGTVAELSTQMFSSHVVEKCIRLAPPELRARLCSELVDPAVVGLLLKDAFGNYVIQTALAVAEADPALFTFMGNSIRPFLVDIRTTPQGKRIQTKIDQVL